MLSKQQRMQEIEEALRADLEVVKRTQAPSFHIEGAVAKFISNTRSDNVSAAWAAAIEQEPASGIVANVIDRVGRVKIAAAGLCLIAGVATAGGLAASSHDPPRRNSPVAIATPNRSEVPDQQQMNVVALAPPPREEPETVMARPRRRQTPAAAETGVEQEIAHMVMLRKLVETKPRRALAWAEQGHRQFANGALYEEREALYVLALIKAEGAAAAKPRAQAFLRHFPKGSFSERIEIAVEH